MCKNLKTLIFDKYIDKNNFADVCYEDDEESDIQNMIEENKKKQNYLSNWIDYSGQVPNLSSDGESDEIDFPHVYFDIVQGPDESNEEYEERIKIINVIDIYDDDDEPLKNFVGFFKTNDFAKSLLLSQMNLENLEVFNSNLNKFYFYNTPNLVNISIPKSDNGRYVKIEGCLYTKSMKKLIVAERNIKSVVINAKCKIITNYALSFESLEKVDFERNSEIQEISFFAFSKSNIKNLTVPDDVKVIDYCAFYECSKLESVTLPSSLNYLDFFTFSYSNLFEITIPNSVLKIDYGCFYRCHNLTKVKFQENSKLREIGNLAFAYTNIETISIPKSVCLISTDSFGGCKNLKSVIFDNKSKLRNLEWNPSLRTLVSKYNRPNSNDQSYKNGLYYENSGKSLVHFDFSVEEVKISKETETIKENALKFSNIVKIDFEPGCKLKVIENSAFECLHIQEISIPNSCTIIGDSVFSCCKLLKKVNINSKSQLISIGNHAFEGTSIETITFPSTLTTIGDYAFFECFNLKTVINKSNKIDFGCRSFSRSAIETIKFPPEAIFHSMSFSECAKLHHLDFINEPKNLIFEENSFLQSGLKILNLECICDIQENAFALCKSLKEVKITRKDSKIHPTSFYNSDNIQNMIINCTISDFKNDEIWRHFCRRNKYGWYIDNDYLFNVKQMYILSQKTVNLDEKSENWFYLYKIYSYLLNFSKMHLKIYYSGNDSNKKRFPQSYLSNKKYQIINGILVNVTLIDNNSLFEEPDQESNDNQIKNNEILEVSNTVKKLNFQATPHIKKIKWEPNCIVNDLGPPGFFSYSNLIEIVIPKLVEKIPPHLFEKCNFLRTVSFEKESILSEIGEFSFADTKIDKILLPKTVQIIHKSAFMNVISLKEVQFYGEIIEDEAFLGTGITSFSVPNNTNSIGNCAFQYCHSLETIIIDPEKSNLSNIGSYAFAETSITRFDIPSKMTIIKEGTFSGCESLKEVLISTHSKLIEIEQYSFAGNLSLKQINIPNTISKISCKSFINTPSLEVIMTRSNKNFIVMNDYSVYSPKRELIFVPRDLESFKIIPKCKIIHEGAFCGPNLKDVIFSDESLLRIEKCAFAHSTGLEKINIPRSISFIGEEAFIDCQKLENVEFHITSKLIEIPKFCFAFSGLKKITLPLFTSIINDSSFFFCQNLKSINLNETEVTLIGNCAFSHTNLDEIIFPKTIKYIGYNAFSNIKSLKMVDFSELGQITISKINFKDLYTKNLSNAKKSLKKINHILDRLNIITTNKNAQIEIVPPKSDSKIKNKKSSYIIQTNKTIDKSYKKSKTSAEIIKPVVNSKISKSHKTISKKTSVHQVAQPSIQNPHKSPRKLHHGDDQQTSILYEKFEKKSTKTKEVSIEEFVDNNYDDMFDNNYDKIFDYEFSRKYEEFTKKGEFKEVLGDDRDNQEIVKEEIVKKSKESHKKVVINSENNENNDKDLIKIKKNKFVAEKQTKKIVKIPSKQTNTIETNIEVNEESNETDVDEKIKIHNVKVKHEKEDLEKKIKINVENKIIKDPSDNEEENEKESDDNENKKSEEEEEVKDKIIEEDFGFEDSSSEYEITSTCYFDKSSFHDSNVQVFKFNLTVYRWFNLFNFCNNIKEYIINPNFHLYLQKQQRENLKCKNILGLYYKCTKINGNPKQISFQYIYFVDRRDYLDFIHRYYYLSYEQYLFRHHYQISEIMKSIMINPFDFWDFTQLIVITLDNNVKPDEIPINCFSFSSLEEITLPKSVQRINIGAFKECYNLKKVIIPKSSQLTSLHSFSFEGCKKLKSIYIPKSVRRIYKQCFSFSGLESIEIPSSVRKIGKYAFFNCKSLNKIILNEGIVELGESSFANNESLESITLPNSLKTIKSNAFSNCYNLTNVTTSKYTKLIEIFNGAFENTQITELKINKEAKILFEPSNVPNLNKIIFCQGEPTNFIQFSDGTIYKKIDDNNIDNIVHRKLPKKSIRENRIFEYFKSISLVSPQMESDIKETILYYFYNHNVPYLLFFKGSLIDNYDEYDKRDWQSNYLYACIWLLLQKNRSTCFKQKENPVLKLVFAPKNLTNLSIHENCFSISNSILDGMKNLSTIDYMKGSTNLILNFPNYNHFYTGKFNQIEKIVISGNYVLMEERAFSYFESLNIVEFKESSNIYFIPKFAFLGCKNLKQINIPASCIMIGEGAFKDCVKLSSVRFLSNKEQKLEFIFDEAFYNCSSLKSISIPPSTSIIKKGAFMNCTKLKQFEIDHTKSDIDSLMIIEKNAFKNCVSLETFNLPQTCLYLGPASFMNCTKLNNFICINSNLNSINCRTFCNCNNLKKFKLTHMNYKNDDTIKSPHFPEVIEYAQKFYINNSQFNIYDEAFMNCTSLKEVVIEVKSKPIDKIRYYQFRNDSSIVSKMNLTFIYRKNQKIHKNAFKNCKMLSDMKFMLGNLESFNEDTFENCSSLKLIEINSIYWPSLKAKSLYMPNDINAKLINDDKLKQKTFIITHKTKKEIIKPQIPYIRKESFIDWPIPENKTKKIEMKSIYYYEDPFKYNYHYKYLHLRTKICTNEKIKTEYVYNIPVPRPPLNI